MTKVEFRCNACAKRYKVDEKYSGKKTKCKACGEAMEIPFPPLELPDEVTTGGSTVYRHESRMRDIEVAVGDSENIELIDAHIKKHIGPVEMVFHELLSDLVHIDIHMVEPTEDRPWYTLVTSGMSDRAMVCPPGMEEFAYAELVVCLPADWQLNQEALEDEKNYWPLRALKFLARFPHEYETWLFEGHTIPNGNPAEPVVDGLGFIGWLLFWPIMVKEEFLTLKVNNEKTIHFLAIYPLFQGEMDLKLKKGTDGLIKRFEKNHVSEVIDIERGDSSRKKGWFS